jgi:hypothetical protein
MSSKFFARILGLLSLTTLLSFSAGAQEKWSWPEKPKNLQVLPKIGPALASSR